MNGILIRYGYPKMFELFHLFVVTYIYVVICKLHTLKLTQII